MAARSLLLGLLLAPPGASPALFAAEEASAAPKKLFRLSFEEPAAALAFVDGTSSDIAGDVLSGDSDGSGSSTGTGANVCGGRLEVQLSEGEDVLTFEPNALCSGEGYSGTSVPSRPAIAALSSGTLPDESPSGSYGEGTMHITLVPGPSSGTYAASIVDDGTGMVHTLMPDGRGEMRVVSLHQDDYDDEDDDLLLPDVEGMDEGDVVAMYMDELDGEQTTSRGEEDGGCGSLGRKKCRRDLTCEWDAASSSCAGRDEPHTMRSHTVVGHPGGNNAYSLRHGAAHNIFVGGDRRRLVGGSSAAGSGDPRRRDLQTTPTHTLDMLVAYTTSAECQNSFLDSRCTPTRDTQTSILARIDLAVKETNEAFALSGIDARVRLVHAVRVEYDETDKTYGNAIAELRVNGDGKADEVHALRTQYGADMVSLLVGIPGSCGIAYVGPNKSAMFSLARFNCATGYYSFGHEAAHNLGCLHDRGTQNACSNPNSNYGYRDPGGRFRSILAYACKTDQCDSISRDNCPRRKFFSNPGTWTEGGVEYPAGTDEANNARQINNVLAGVSNFYATVVPGEEPECESDSDCDDGDACNGDETCDSDGVCQAGPPAESCCGNSVCDGDETPLACPSDCTYDCGGTCSELETTFAGGNGSAGNYFTVEASRDLFVTSFTVHTTTTGPGAVRIYHRPGEYGDHITNPDGWNLVYEDEALDGRGNGKETPLGKLPRPVLAEAGTRHSFYVYASRGVRYTTTGGDEGDVFRESGELVFYEGRGSGGEFSASTWAPRIWNGRIEYGLADGSTPPPTKFPTGPPTGFPTGRPTGRPTTAFPTSEPSGKPTNPPTGKPTRPPTKQPTRPPTSPPTSLPTGSPSRDPTSQPTDEPTPSPSSKPTDQPSSSPTTAEPTGQPTAKPVTGSPTAKPSPSPSAKPTNHPPTGEPTAKPATGSPTARPSPSPSAKPTDQPSPSPTTAEPTAQPSAQSATQQDTQSPVSSSMVRVEVIVTTDRYPKETSWTLRDVCGDGAVIGSGSGYNGLEKQYSEAYTVPSGRFEFQIFDAYADGICCAYGDGSYQVSVDGQVVMSGGSFQSSETAVYGECSDGIPTPAPTTIAPSPASNIASFDATLGAPRCSSVTRSCTTVGTALLRGKANNVEMNGSNALGSACRDGAKGSYGLDPATGLDIAGGDESIEHVTVTASDAPVLRAGGNATVTAVVHTWSTGSADHVDFFVTGDPTAPEPVWEYVSTASGNVPGDGQIKTLTSAKFKLPNSELLAVRVNMRYSGKVSPTACSGGSYDDVDALVFAAEAASFDSAESPAMDFLELISDSKPAVQPQTWVGKPELDIECTSIDTRDRCVASGSCKWRKTRKSDLNFAALRGSMRRRSCHTI